jgi:hypothetical protein
VLQQFYNVTIDDNHGGSVTKAVEIDITGTNDAPVIAFDDHAENGLFVAGGFGTDVANGAIHFSDPDLTDRPTATASFISATYMADDGSALALAPGVLAALKAAFSIAPHAGNTNTGEIDWTFSIADVDFLFMDRDQTVMLTEAVTVKDAAGASDTSTVTVVIGGGDSLIGTFDHNTFFATSGDAVFIGTGSDTYAFTSTNVGSIVLAAFNNIAQNDHIQVSAAGFGGGLTAGEDLTGVFSSDATKGFAVSTERFHFDTANHTLYYSANGTAASAIALAQVVAAAAFQAHDIHVVA